MLAVSRNRNIQLAYHYTPRAAHLPLTGNKTLGISVCVFQDDREVISNTAADSCLSSPVWSAYLTIKLLLWSAINSFKGNSRVYIKFSYLIELVTAVSTFLILLIIFVNNWNFLPQNSEKKINWSSAILVRYKLRYHGQQSLINCLTSTRQVSSWFK